MLDGMIIGFAIGNFFAYLFLFLPIQKLNKRYQERLENRLKGIHK